MKFVFSFYRAKRKFFKNSSFKWKKIQTVPRMYVHLFGRYEPNETILKYTNRSLPELITAFWVTVLLSKGCQNFVES